VEHRQHGFKYWTIVNATSRDQKLSMLTLKSRKQSHWHWLIGKQPGEYDTLGVMQPADLSFILIGPPEQHADCDG
jgi:hypothetical protein